MIQKIRTLLFLTACLYFFTAASHSFKTDQKKYATVKEAYLEKEKTVTAKLAAKGINITEPIEIYLRAFKSEEVVELWAKNKTNKTFQLIDTFEVCSLSGELGPKRKQGDRQVPEGFYHIDRFNPQSSFHLSLGINYPNTSDKILGGTTKLGGDIFIHGSCVSIGCLAMTDDKIKEIYLYAVEAFSGGQNKIPVTIFPARLTGGKSNQLNRQHPDQVALWNELKTAYTLFNTNKALPNVSFLDSGRHRVY